MFKRINIFKATYFSILFIVGISLSVSSQIHPRILTINNKIGPVIDSIEKRHYDLFPEYPDETFRAAQFIKNPDGTIEIHLYPKEGKKEVRIISEEEYSLYKKKVRSRKLPEKQSPDKIRTSSKDSVYRPIRLKRKAGDWEYYAPYTAEAFYDENFHERYYYLKLKISKDKVLSESEKQWFLLYDSYIRDYYSNMSEIEQARYLSSITAEEKEHLQVLLKEDEIQDVSDDMSVTYFTYRNSIQCGGILPFVSYERNIQDRQNWAINLNMSVYPSVIGCSGAYLHRKRNNFIEVNLGGMVTYDGDHFIPLISFGYRYQKPHGRFLFKTGGSIPTIIYVGVGYCF